MVTVRQVQQRAEFEPGYVDETALYDAWAEESETSSYRKTCPSCGDGLGLHSINDLYICLERS